ncbi:SDR family NAD(P)-dependent oxidoreductase [Paratissierella segnis]|jgi:short-subunit dehydrogenase|uniref:SDR family NAD(P)-dependent oxidoreductase n=1 Tax=Paratissierella segnis TaxID=2763679 RepID=A0A926EWH9_9FIRM|nr:SDR family oxidoreductase [Paratissierella segnis]MBC8587734.1 SDR family NAD(P)-dependent oxidoreductase [Paratissierella segnis]
MKTMVIAGAGKGLGLSLAKVFGKEGFQIALIARNAEKLQSIVNELQAQGIEASYYLADLTKKEAVEKAMTDIKVKYGVIDIMELSPVPTTFLPATAVKTTAENAMAPFEGFVISAINVANSLLPDMLERGEGALLFTTGLSAMYPIPMLGNIGIAMAGLRSYIMNLHTELSPKGILVAHRSLGLMMKAGTGAVNDPDVIAKMWYQVYSEKLDGEQEYPKGVTPKTMVF